MTNYWQGGLTSRQVVHHPDKRTTISKGRCTIVARRCFRRGGQGLILVLKNTLPWRLASARRTFPSPPLSQTGMASSHWPPSIAQFSPAEVFIPHRALDQVSRWDGGVIARECEPGVWDVRKELFYLTTAGGRETVGYPPSSAVDAQCRTTVVLDGVPHPFIGVPQLFQYDVSSVTLASIPVARLYDPTAEGFWTLAFKSSIQIASHRRVTTVGSHLAPQLGNLNDSNVRKQALITGLIKNCVDSAGVRSTLQGRGAF